MKRKFGSSLLRVFMLCLLLTSFENLLAQCGVNSLIINTGYNPSTGVQITPGVGLQDPKWEVSALSSDLAPIASPNSPVYSAYVTNEDFAWATNPTSGWIGVIPDYWYGTDGSLFYEATFRRSFTTCFEDEITFNLDIANDNYCPQIRVDGTPVPVSSPFSQPATFVTSNYTSFTNVNFAMTLPPGTHTIEIDVVNIAVWNNFNPHGLNIVGTVSSTASNSSIVSEDPACATYTCCSADAHYCSNSANPYQFDFSADVTGLPSSSYTWKVNGSVVSNGATYNHTFPSWGVYNVCLEVFNPANGVTCEKCMDICVGKFVGDEEECNFDFTFCFNSSNPYYYEFTADNTSLPSSAYSWIIDGTPTGLIGPHLSLLFSGPGSHDICLRVVDGETICEKCIKMCVAENPEGAYKSTAKKELKENGVSASNMKFNLTSSVANMHLSKIEITKLYPNPAHGSLNVELANVTNETVTVKMYNVLGKLVLEQINSSRNRKLIIQTDKLVPGVYMMSINDGSTSTHQKVTIE